MSERKGFTLVELLVVISIIALLMAIMMPALRTAKQQAGAIRCLSNLRNLGFAWHMYQDDNDGSIVGAHTQLSNGEGNEDFYFCWVERPQREDGHRADMYPKLEDEINGIERGLLYSYVAKSEKVYHCPSDKRVFKGETGYRSYSIAGCMNGYWNTIDLKVAKKYTQVRGPSEKYVFVEEQSTGNPGYNRDAWQLRPTGDSWIDPVAVWHGDKSTLAYADGHAEKHKWKDKRTIQFSQDRKKYTNLQPDNEDLKYMQRCWTRP